jgi:lipopolysaccharide assembly outer membrane protein LptD (OstA)
MNVRVMSELIFRATVSDSKNIGVGCPQVIIDFDTLLIQFYSCNIEANIFYIRFSPSSNKYRFNLDSLFDAILSIFYSDCWEATIFSSRWSKFKTYRSGVKIDDDSVLFQLLLENKGGIGVLTRKKFSSHSFHFFPIGLIT